MDSSNINQLSVAILLLIGVTISAIVFQKKQITVLILLTIPFQLVENKYGTSGVAIAYLGMLAVWLKGWRYVPYPFAITGLGTAFILSLIFAHNGIAFLNIIYTINFWSAIAIFYIFYNYARAFGSKDIEPYLLAVNVMVLAYCVGQIIAGPGEAFSPFGLDALEFHTNRGREDPRLVGPFSAPGATATYFVVMIMVCLKVLHRKQQGLIILPFSLLIMNYAGIALTGNRGGLISAVLGSLIYIAVVAKDFRVSTRIGSAMGIFLIICAAVFATSSTNFDTIVNRLGDITESRDGLPETRARTWAESVEKIKQTPWTGDGPYLLYQERAEQLGMLRTNYDKFPHSLYLYILRTLGVIGLAAFLLLFLLMVDPFKRNISEKVNLNQQFDKGFLRLLIAVFLINQITLEFIRISYMDLAQFVFAVFGNYAGARSIQRPSIDLSSGRIETR